MSDERLPPQYRPHTDPGQQQPAEDKAGLERQLTDNRDVLARLVAIDDATPSDPPRDRPGRGWGRGAGVALGMAGQASRDPKALIALATVVVLGTATWFGTHPPEGPDVTGPVVTPTTRISHDPYPDPDQRGGQPAEPTQPPTTHLKTSQVASTSGAHAPTRRAEQIQQDRPVLPENHKATEHRQPSDNRDGEPAHHRSQTDGGSDGSTQHKSQTDGGSDGSTQHRSQTDDPGGEPTQHKSQTDDPGGEPTQRESPTEQAPKNDGSGDGGGGDGGGGQQPANQSDCVLEVKAGGLLDLGVLCG